jgi:hypothetical protein
VKHVHHLRVPTTPEIAVVPRPIIGDYTYRAIARRAVVRAAEQGGEEVLGAVEGTGDGHAEKEETALMKWRYEDVDWMAYTSAVSTSAIRSACLQRPLSYHSGRLDRMLKLMT